MDLALGKLAPSTQIKTRGFISPLKLTLLTVSIYTLIIQRLVRNGYILLKIVYATLYTSLRK